MTRHWRSGVSSGSARSRVCKAASGALCERPLTSPVDFSTNCQTRFSSYAVLPGVVTVKRWPTGAIASTLWMISAASRSSWSMSSLISWPTTYQTMPEVKTPQSKALHNREAVRRRRMEGRPCMVISVSVRCSGRRNAIAQAANGFDGGLAQLAAQFEDVNFDGVAHQLAFKTQHQHFEFALGDDPAGP